MPIARPIDVVVLPSPAGVGLIAVTRTSRPLPRAARARARRDRSSPCRGRRARRARRRARARGRRRGSAAGRGVRQRSAFRATRPGVSRRARRLAAEVRRRVSAVALARTARASAACSRVTSVERVLGVAVRVAVADEEIDVLADALGAERGRGEARAHREEVDLAAIARGEDGAELDAGDVDAREREIRARARRSRRARRRAPRAGRARRAIATSSQMPSAREVVGERRVRLDADRRAPLGPDAPPRLGRAEEAALAAGAEDHDRVARAREPRDLGRGAGDVEQRRARAARAGRSGMRASGADREDDRPCRRRRSARDAGRTAPTRSSASGVSESEASVATRSPGEKPRLAPSSPDAARPRRAASRPSRSPGCAACRGARPSRSTSAADALGRRRRAASSICRKLAASTFRVSTSTTISVSKILEKSLSSRSAGCGRAPRGLERRGGYRAGRRAGAVHGGEL